MAATVRSIAKPTCPACGKDDAVKRKQKRWYCFRDDAYIDEAPGAESLEPLSDGWVEACHQALLGSDPVLEWLAETRGIPRKIVEKYRLGLDGGKVTLPVMNDDGAVINVRSMYPKPGEHLRGMGGRSVQIYPPLDGKSKEVWLVEGEWDCLVGRTLGLPTHTGTGGAGVFHKRWATAIAEQAESVVVLYDADPSKPGRGRAGAAGRRIVIERLVEAGISPALIKAPEVPVGKDLSDWVVDHGATRQDAIALVAQTHPWSHHQIEEGGVPEDPPERTLLEAGASGNAWQWSRFPGCILSLGTDPYQLPRRVQLTCTQAQGRLCSGCVMPAVYATCPGEQVPEVEIPVTSEYFPAFVGLDEDALKARIYGSLGIPAKCPEIEMTPIEAVRVQEGRIMDTFRLSAEHQPIERKALFLGFGDELDVNREYSMVGFTRPLPRTQEMAHLIYRADPTDDVTGGYEPDPATLAPLKKMARKKPETRLTAIAEDASHITSIWGRPDMHLTILLTYCSTLWLLYRDEHQRGWLDVSIVGDTSEGKSETAEHLVKWFGLGSMISLKTVSRAGLFGGVVRDGHRFYLQWGHIPRADRRLLIMDEANAASYETLHSLTSARSSGVAEIHLAGAANQRKTYARTRLVTLANPRIRKEISDYTYPVDAHGDLFGRVEDLRRLDIGLTVMRGTVTEDVRNQAPSDPEFFSRDLARTLLATAWTQRGVQVGKLLPAAKRMTSDLTKRYDHHLLNPGDLRWKLCRIAVAAANLLGEGVKVAHVEWAAEWLDKIYSSPESGMRELSDTSRSLEVLADEKDVWRALEVAGNPSKLVSLFLTESEWGGADFADFVVGGDRDLGNHLRSTLVQNRALVRRGRRYCRTPAFVDFLKRKERERT